MPFTSINSGAERRIDPENVAAEDQVRRKVEIMNQADRASQRLALES